MRVNELMKFCFLLAREFNCAVILAAHPRKEGEEPISLEDNPNRFFESIMGTSHFINSTGSLWGLERKDEDGHSLFLGGRQRGEGSHGISRIRKGDSGFELVDDFEFNLRLVLNTNTRRAAWEILPSPPATFGYRKGQSLVKPVMASGTYAAWVKECRRLGVVVQAGLELAKATSVSRAKKPEAAEAGRKEEGSSSGAALRNASEAPESPPRSEPVSGAGGPGLLQAADSEDSADCDPGQRVH